MKPDNQEIKSPLLKEISKYVKYILSVMGFIKDDDFSYIYNEDTEVLLDTSISYLIKLR